MKWMKSAGGPLICLETPLMSSWCGAEGTFRTGKCVASQHSDYDRACAMSDYAGLVDVDGGSALVLGDLPLATTVFGKAPFELYVVRAVYMDPGTEVALFADYFDESFFRASLEALNFTISSDALAMFDSALPGSDQSKEVLAFSLSPGRYEIKTALVDPDERTSLVVHRLCLNA
jgi:hypothetical protein